MYKVLSVINVITILSTVYADQNVEKFLGKWLPIKTYPNIPTLPLCVWFEMHKNDTEVSCDCGDKKDVPIFSTKRISDTSDFPEINSAIPAIIVDKASEVDAALHLDCYCNGEKSDHAVFRYINQKYFIYFMLVPKTTYTEKEPNSAVLVVKDVTSTEELVKAEKEIEDLKNRNGALLCDPTNL